MDMIESQLNAEHGKKESNYLEKSAKEPGEQKIILKADIGILIPINKHGNSRNCTNYRGVNI